MLTCRPVNNCLHTHMKDLHDWLAGSRDYNEGLVLLRKYCHNRALIKFCETKQTAHSVAKLSYELEKIANDDPQAQKKSSLKEKDNLTNKPAKQSRNGKKNQTPEQTEPQTPKQTDQEGTMNGSGSGSLAKSSETPSSEGKANSTESAAS